MVITDGSRTLDCTFFNQRQHKRVLKPGINALFAGKVSRFRNKLQLTNPDYQLLDEESGRRHGREVHRPDPGLPGGRDDPVVADRQVRAAGAFDARRHRGPDAGGVAGRRGLANYDDAIRKIHTAAEWPGVQPARERLKWDEAMAVQLALAQRRQRALARPAPECARREDGLRAAFDKRLPFTLTAGQQEVGEKIAADLERAHPMNRLLQGEVGSGKTIVALRAMLQVVDAGRQAALLAPTEVLAAQHARSLGACLVTWRWRVSWARPSRRPGSRC